MDGSALNLCMIPQMEKQNKIEASIIYFCMELDEATAYELARARLLAFFRCILAMVSPTC
jgi:hypothetical protein